MTTENNNKLIALFMEAKQYDKEENYIYFDETNNMFSNDTISIKNLKFHSSWNWLMEVVEKIENLKSDVIIQGNSFGYLCSIRHFKGVTDVEYKFQSISKTSKIEAVYQAGVQFITWYNEQQK